MNRTFASRVSNRRLKWVILVFWVVLAAVAAPLAGGLTDQQDNDIASWLLAERIPRATQDARWPTLLYPIHLLEQLLKRRIAAMTVGWPAQ